MSDEYHCRAFHLVCLTSNLPLASQVINTTIRIFNYYLRVIQKLDFNQTGNKLYKKTCMITITKQT